MNIIIVEDEGVTALYLEETLQDLGHNIITMFNNGTKLLNFLKENNNIDLILMDINIQGSLDGIQVGSTLRQFYPNISIVYITSYTDSSTISSAQMSKPLGYLIKPIKIETLEGILMVVESQRKESLPDNLDNKISIKGYYYDDETRNFSKNNQKITLTNHELICLETLFKYHKTHISNKQLMNIIWDDTNKISSLRELISRLRKKISDLDIVSIPNVGYTLE